MLVIYVVMNLAVHEQYQNAYLYRIKDEKKYAKCREKRTEEYTFTDKLQAGSKLLFYGSRIM